MAAANAAVFRLRRFRLALIAVVAAPWLLGLALALVWGWHYRSVFWVVFALTIDTALVAFALRSPGGFATWWIMVRLVVGAATLFIVGHGAYAFVYGAFDAAAALLLAVLIAPMWRDVRRDRAAKKLASNRARRAEPYSPFEMRQAVKRAARIERDGYL